MEINRVIEIDMDTSRNPATRVRVVKTTPHRDGVIPHETDIKKDLAVLTEGLLCLIIHAEQQGVYKTGECMKKAVENLQDGYTDASVEISEFENDEQGNVKAN